MKCFAVNTLGCKVNQYESQQIRELLERVGLCAVETSKEKPDLIVVNTCCVTHTASAKSRQCISKAQRLHPGATIVVCGCLPSLQIGELNNQCENVHLIRDHESLAASLSIIAASPKTSLGPHCFHFTPHNIIRTESGKKIKNKNPGSSQSSLPQLTSFRGQTRAFLKIQDGCDGYCSYCIIPRTRPFVRSKAPEAALREAQVLAEAGHKEIVLTGICLGAYGRESVRNRAEDGQSDEELAQLLEKMAEIPGLARIRLSSLEPNDVSPRLLDVLCENPNIMPHLHLSLQSGSENVLRKMCRQYTPDDFRTTVEAIRSRLDRPAITTDIIVGFPGETDGDFQQTFTLAREIGFAKIHVFSFSPRKGTAAARMQHPVDKRVMKDRAAALQRLDWKSGRDFRAQFLGETAEILVEDNAKNPQGRSERYFMVRLEGRPRPGQQNTLVRVRLTKNDETGMTGQVLGVAGSELTLAQSALSSQ